MTEHIYVLYDKTSGEVLAWHREIFAESDETVALSEKEVLAATGYTSAEDINVAVLAVDERPQARKGYRVYVEPNIKQLIELEVS